MKVCFAASSGGHYEQLMMLRPLFEKYDSFIVTEQTKYKTTQGSERVYRLFQVNRREKKCIFLMLLNLAFSVAIFLRERPDFVITTGVLAVIPMCILAKVFRRKLIYIESFAKVSSPTETGKLMYRLADRFYVQWEPMLKVFPKAIYLGGIY